MLRINIFWGNNNKNYIHDEIKRRIYSGNVQHYSIQKPLPSICFPKY
jgi:hypothetical protein